MKTILNPALLVMLVAPLAGHAALSPVLNRGDVAWNSSLDWAGTGVAYDLLTNPFSTSTTLGNGVTVGSGSGQPLERADEGDGWSGNFAPGEALLYSGFGSGGPLTVTFDRPVLGLGAQFQAAELGAFTIQLEAFNSANVSLGTVTRSGTSTSAADATAAFLGFTETLGEVKSFTIQVTSDAKGGLPDFALNRLSVMEVPEAHTWVAAASLAGLAGGIWLRRRNRA